MNHNQKGLALLSLPGQKMLMERTETMSSLSALASPQSCRRKLFSPESWITLDYYGILPGNLGNPIYTMVTPQNQESMPSPPSTASSDLTDTTDKGPKDGKAERVSRAKNLTEEEKNKIAAMQKPSDMDYKDASLRN